MIERLRMPALLAAAGALLAVPAVGQAHGKGERGPGERGKTPGAKGRSCAKPTVSKGFVVKGTLESFTPDDPAAPGDQERVTLTVTRANRHARNAELADADATKAGLQYAIAGDPFKVKLSGYEAGEAPESGDRVRVVGKVAVTKKRCAAPGADRYGDVNVRRVKIVDAD